MWTHTTLTSTSLSQPHTWAMRASEGTMKLGRSMSISMI